MHEESPPCPPYTGDEQRSFPHLWLPHLQLDELRTRLRCSKQVLWLWVAIDPCTKLLPAFQLGPRTQYMAYLLIHSIRQMLAPGCLPLFTSDGLNLYFSSPHACSPIWSGGELTHTDAASSRITASGAHPATRTRGQTIGATLSTTDASHGNGKNQPTMDSS
jgi:hypothetical protein